MKTVLLMFGLVVLGGIIYIVIARNSEERAAVEGSAGADNQREPDERSQRARSNPHPMVGEMAPTFKLKSFDNFSETDLASFRGRIPVVLVFGSYT